jgi:EAL domain-containing protein (putative c-di-GMP-specific phosphodiesterase class I)
MKSWLLLTARSPERPLNLKAYNLANRDSHQASDCLVWGLNDSGWGAGSVRHKINLSFGFSMKSQGAVGVGMQKQDWPYVSAVLFGLAIAIGSGFYMIGGGTAPLLAIVVAVLALGLSQAAILVFVARRSADLGNDRQNTQSDIAVTLTNARDARIQFEGLRKSFDELKLDAKRDRELTARGFTALKESYTSLQAEIQRTTHYQQPTVEQVFTSPPVQNNHSIPVESQEKLEHESPFGDQLSVSLEPIIDLTTGRTAHYRMHLGLANGKGEELASDTFLHHAERIGARPALDIFVCREADALLRKLRQRDPNLNIFMPIGASTLASRESIAQINVDRKAAADVSQGLIFEFPHAMLAGLTEQALEGLAELARQGARFGLSNVSIAGLDLNAMNTLNVRFVSLDSNAIDPVHGPSLAMASFTQSARASRVQMIVSGVADQRIIGKLPQITRLVSGPCFAPPRRVKKELVESTAVDLHAAA